LKNTPIGRARRKKEPRIISASRDFGGAALADSILDRLLHNVHRIEVRTHAQKSVEAEWITWPDERNKDRL
jgi:hypothetical protein